MAFLFGLALGVGIGYFVGKKSNNDDGGYEVDQSNNTVGGDLVGRDKSQR